MKKHLITIGGLPGSGKSTVKNLLAERLGYETFSTGEFTRTLAVERGMTLEAFNEEVAKNKDLDLRIDRELERIEAEEDNMVVDSHLAFYFVPSAFTVFLELDLAEGARRIFEDTDSELRQKSGDTMQTLDEALARTQKRVENHRTRYKKHYGIDPYDSSQYDLVVNTQDRAPDEVADLVYDAYQAWLTT